MSDPWAEFTPAPPRAAPRSVASDDPWAEFTPAPSSGGVHTIPPQDGRPARVIMNMGGAPERQTAPSNEPPGVLEDILKSIGGGLIRGTAGLLGLPGLAADYLEYGADYGASALTGESQDEFERRRAQKRQDAMFPGVMDAISPQGIQHSIESVTGPAHMPQTTPGQFASTAAEFVPGGAIGKFPNLLRNAVAFGAVPGLVSEGAGQAFKGSPMETPARIAGAVAGGFGSAGAMRMSSADRLVQNAGKGVTAAELDATEELFRRARQQGVDISRAEALQSVTSGRTGLGDLQHTVEGLGGMREFYAGRPAQNEAAARQAFEGIARQPLDPSGIGRQASGAAQQTVGDVRGLINKASEPFYRRAEGILLDPQEMALVQRVLGYKEAAKAVREDPQLNSYVAHLPGNSIGFLNQVKIWFDQNKTNAGSKFNPQANQQRSAAHGNAADTIKQVGIAKSPDYEAALMIQQQAREKYLQPLLDGPLGKLAKKDRSTKDAINALFPPNPVPNSDLKIYETMTALVKRNQWAARQLIRAHAESVFNAAAKRLASSGPAQGGGAKFVAVLRGNPQQAQNLEAAVRALPNGDATWQGFNKFLEVMEAQQFRQATGSRTAFNKPAVDQLKGDGLIKSGAEIASTGGFAALKKVSGAFDNWSVGRNLDQLADVLTNPNATSAFRAMVTAPKGSAKAAALASRIIYLGVNAKRSGDREANAPVRNGR